MNLKTCFILLFLFSAIFDKLEAQDFKEVEKTFSIDPNGTLSIETYKGTIKIVTWDKPDIYIHAKMESDDSGWFLTSEEEQLENVKVVFNAHDNYVSVKSEYQKAESWHESETRAFVHYQIKMPKTVELKVDDYKSNTTIHDLKSKIDFETYKGTVTIKDVTGPIDLETYKGDIEITFDALKDNCNLETYKGSINLYVPSNAAFNLDLDLGKKGDFSSDFDIDGSSRSRKNRDEIKESINGGGPYIEFTTYKGEINIRKT